MAMRFGAGVCKRHSAFRSLDLDWRCGFGGAGQRHDWERVRSGADRGRRRRGRLGRIGRRGRFGKGTGKGKVRRALLWRHFVRLTTLVEFN